MLFAPLLMASSPEISQSFLNPHHPPLRRLQQILDRANLNDSRLLIDAVNLELLFIAPVLPA